MQRSARFLKNRMLYWLLLVLFLIALAAMLLPRHFVVGLASYLPLHTAIEGFSVVVAMLIFTVGINVHRAKIAANLVLLPCAFLAVGLLDFGHILSYDGMPDFVTPADHEKAIYFWLAARGVSVLALLAVAALPWQREAGTRLQQVCLASALALVAGVYWLILFHQDSLPRVFDPATGLTPFKRGMEYLLVGITAAAAVLAYRRRNSAQGCDPELLFAALVAMGLGEVFFAVYAAISDHLNLLGHVYKIIAYYLLYRAVVAYAIQQPYGQLFESERRLRESAENLALLGRWNDLILDAAGEGICGVDTQGTIVFANPAAARMLGYAVAELHGRSLHDTTHHTRPDGSPYPAAECPILATLNSGRTCHEGDESYWRKDGTSFSVEYTSTPIVDEGKAIGAVVMFSDITRRRQAEETLREWWQLVEHAAWGMAIGDAESRRIKLVNPAFARMHGYEAQELIGMRVDGLYDAESRTDIPRLDASLRNDKHLGFECVRLRKNGSTFPALVDVSIVEGADGKANYIANVQDITQRKRIEAALRESEELFRNLFSGITDAILVHPITDDGTLGHFSVVNNVACEWLGYTHREMLAMTPRDIEAPDTGIDTAPIARRVAAGESVTFEQVFVARNGRRIPVEIRANPFLLHGQKAVIALVRDIAERKQAEAALRESERLYRDTFEYASVGILHTSLEGKWLHLNPKFCEITGYSHDELMQKTFQEITHPEDAEQDAPVMRLMMAGEISYVSREKRYIHKGGAIIWVHLDVSLMRDAEGRPQYFVVVVQDISERKHAETLLRWSEKRFRATFEQAAVGMAHAMPNGTFLRVNDKFCEIVGHPRAELMRLTFQEITYPDDLKKNLDYMRQALAGEINVFAMEKRYVRKDQTLVWVSLTVTHVRKADGTPDYSVGVIEDISARKRVEQKLRELSVHLQTVREEEKANIAREIHDDLGSTLTALKMDIYWLARMLPAEKDMVPLLERVESLSGLLDDAVGVTRRLISELRPTVLDDLGLLAALEWQCEQFQMHSGIECRAIGVRDDGVQGELDGKQSINLFRIVQEALTNISRHSGASRVEVELYLGEDEVLLSISDNGCGLPPDRAVAPDSYGMRGMLERAEYLGGTVRFDSSPGEGTTVTVRLPQPDEGQEKEKT